MIIIIFIINIIIIIIIIIIINIMIPWLGFSHKQSKFATQLESSHLKVAWYLYNVKQC